jgi:serpin B
MAANGADEPTRKAMEKTLGIDAMGLPAANVAYANLLARLQTDSPQSTLTIANSLWIAEGMHVADAFLGTNRDYYAAEATNVAFGAAEANKRIDAWVNARTHGLIPQLFGDQALGRGTVIVLVNALYFKSDWAHEFDPDDTRVDTFTVGPGETLRVPLMSTKATFGYLADPSFTAARLPYKDGKRALYLFVPRPEPTALVHGSELDHFLERLDAQHWDQWMRDFKETPDVRVVMPKMKLKTSVDLEAPLTALGMGPAFDGGFGPMTDSKSEDGVAITNVRHAVVVEIDEKGTKAAAATGVPMAKEVISNPPQVIADRPFFFAVRDEASGLVLFAGAVRDPR